jgi:hypothetical protein
MQSAFQDGGANAPLLGGAGINISFVAGTINDGDEPMRMARMLFRATRGKALTHFAEKPFIQDGKPKITYMIVF